MISAANILIVPVFGVTKETKTIYSAPSSLGQMNIIRLQRAKLTPTGVLSCFLFPFFFFHLVNLH